MLHYHLQSWSHQLVPGTASVMYLGSSLDAPHPHYPLLTGPALA